MKMSDYPYLLSIMVCVYNQEKLILRALDSIPKRKDIQIVVVDDCSTDGTRAAVENWMLNNYDMDIDFISLPVNKGLGNAKNEALRMCQGEYIGELDSDDWLETGAFEKVMEYCVHFPDADIICYDLVINNGNVLHVSENSEVGLCAGIARFYKRSLIGDTRWRERRAGEDWYFNQDMLAKPHKSVYTGIVAYHYNFPREGSLFDQMVKGELKEEP